MKEAALKIKTAIGMMSGTSMDGIDLALVRTDGEAWVERGPNLAVGYEKAFRDQLADALATARMLDDRSAILKALDPLASEIEHRHATALTKFLRANGIERADVDVIGFHGQTVLHRPNRGFTVQIGDGARLAALAGIKVVWDMRLNDMIHGGQGAPLVPAYHRALAHGLGLNGPVMFVNIGGISNITWVNEGHDPVAFDSGPGNALIDQWVQSQAGIPFDDGGRIASEGHPVASVVARDLDRPFFRQSGAKSLDRLDFDLEPVEGLELSDGAATLADVTAEAILKAADHVPEPPKTWVICGGGRKNASIVNALREKTDSSSQILIAEDVGLDGGATEAEAWAYLAVRASDGGVLTWPSTTGVRKPVTGGFISKP